MAAPSKVWVYGRSLAGVAGLNPVRAWIFFPCECCVLSGRGLLDMLTTRPEELYRM